MVPIVQHRYTCGIALLFARYTIASLTPYPLLVFLNTYLTTAITIMMMFIINDTELTWCHSMYRLI